jgi:hypothetical protein
MYEPVEWEGRTADEVDSCPAESCEAPRGDFSCTSTWVPYTEIKTGRFGYEVFFAVCTASGALLKYLSCWPNLCVGH